MATRIEFSGSEVQSACPDLSSRARQRRGYISDIFFYHRRRYTAIQRARQPKPRSLSPLRINEAADTRRDSPAWLRKR